MMTNRDFTCLEDVLVWLNPDSFLSKYIRYQSALETSLVYDFWGAMFCLSNAVTRDCIVDRPRAPVYLNLYVILTAESGVTRKSTSVNTAMRVMEKFNERIGNTINIIHTKTTPERLEEVLSASSQQHDTAHFAFIVSELVTALGTERYNLSMPGLLTDLYDAPALRRTTGTVSRGAKELRNVYGTFLSASTPTWLTRAINPDVIEGGFTSRVFFVISDAPKHRVAWPIKPDDSSSSELAEQLVGIHESVRPSRNERRWGQSTRRFGLTHGALEAFTRWYEQRELGVDAFTTSFDAREDAHVLKVAALFAINDARGTIDIPDIDAAIYIVNETVKKRSVELLAYQVNNTIVDTVEKVRNLLVQHPTGIKHSEIIRRLQGTSKAKRITVVLDLMHTLGMVRKWQYGHLAQGRPGISWSPNAELKSHDFLQIMMENLEGAG